MSVLESITTELKNRRKTDKAALGYYINALESYSAMGMYWDSFKRDELLEKLLSLLENPKSINRMCQFVPFRYLQSSL